ncbi:MAG: uracil-DNA glycosylase [Candidatus Omnitrophica bacterium]|nr:uracil-DNA glycosylase [Candidatus Omnitrophota bacterium]
MDSPESFREQLSETIEQLKARLEFEAYFAVDYLPGSSLGPDRQLDNQVGPDSKQQVVTDLKADSLDSAELIQSADNKQARIKSLYQKTRTCAFCDLHKTRTNVVFGDGSLDAELVFIGEAPGHEEDISAKPFVGLAGGLLTKIINAMKFKRSDVYITNLLRCRPPNNRNPLPEEVVCCKPYLIELLEIIKPKVICTLGKFAAHTLLNQTIPISQLRGQWFEFKGIKLMPTFHPAYLLRNPQDKKLVWADMKKIMDVLNKYET